MEVINLLKACRFNLNGFSFCQSLQDSFTQSAVCEVKGSKGIIGLLLPQTSIG